MSPQTCGEPCGTFPLWKSVIRKTDLVPESQAKVDSEPTEVHLTDSPYATQTACGVPVDGLSALCHDVAMFRSLARPCSECLHATGS